MLLLSYCFPPVAAAESLLVAKTLGNLPGYTVDVITLDAAANGQNEDLSLDEYGKSRFSKVHRLGSPWYFRLLPKGRFPCRLLPFVCRRPDVMRFNNGAALKAALEMNAEDYDVIFTWSQWHSVHLVGAKLKEMFPNINWVVRMSDPWFDNPFVNYGPVSGPINRRLEKRVVELADRIWFTTDQTDELVMSKYPDQMKSKVSVVPHPFDPSLYPDPVREVPTEILFRYLGYFYGIRSPKPLFKALQQIYLENPEVLDGVVFEIVGGLGSTSQDILSEGLPKGLVRIVPPVDYLESLKLMVESDVLMVIDAPADLSVFLPSKLVDYLGSGRPVIGITPPGASAELIEKTGGLVADPTDIDGIATIVREMITKVCVNRDSHNGSLITNAEAIAGYSTESVAQQVEELLSEDNAE